MTNTTLFGDRLRRARERRQLTLHDVAQQTKIGVPTLAALEAGTCARWPVGVYSRSYVRSYAEIVGIDVSETLADFIELFPHLAWTEQDHAAAVVPRRPRWSAGQPLRLVLAEQPVPLWRRLLTRLAWSLYTAANGRPPVTSAEPVPEAAAGDVPFAELQLDR